MKQKQTIDALVELGNRLQKKENIEQHLNQAILKNAWFSNGQYQNALNQWTELLTLENLQTFATHYSFDRAAKQVAIIMAGNIPMVGFHDLLCVLLSGHKAMVKLSTDDEVFMSFLIAELMSIDPEFKEFIQQVERVNEAEAAIATGSNNSSRYFEFYFKNIPHIIRKNRKSVAVLDGTETEDEFKALGKDLFQYFGLGCRNVSKLLVPENYDFTPFFEGIESYSWIQNHNKYANNYTYHKAIYLMNGTEHLDNGFVLIKPGSTLHAPLSTVHHSSYKDQNDLSQWLSKNADDIQCVVGSNSNQVPFGTAQRPSLEDFADNVDTMRFLASI